MQERSLARQRRWLFKAQPVARQGSVSFRVKLTFAANGDQRQVSAVADIRHPKMNDRNQSDTAGQNRKDRATEPGPGSRATLPQGLQAGIRSPLAARTAVGCLVHAAWASISSGAGSFTNACACATVP